MPSPLWDSRDGLCAASVGVADDRVRDVEWRVEHTGNAVESEARA
jgi:hypothetical protein